MRKPSESLLPLALLSDGPLTASLGAFDADAALSLALAPVQPPEKIQKFLHPGF